MLHTPRSHFGSLTAPSSICSRFTPPFNFRRPPHRYQTTKSRSGRPMAAVKEEVWALDFDGVVVDSVGESSLSAWLASEKLWPEYFERPKTQCKKEEVLEQMRIVRPVVETGYENLVQIRCLLEGVAVEEMLDTWHTMLPEYMQKWSLDRSELVGLFGGTRDEWMARDLDDWLAANRIYPGVADILKTLKDRAEVYIVTTKQARFTEALLRDMAKVPFPMDRIFSQTESGRPKSEVLLKLEAAHPGASYFFVEDKLATLEKVAKQPECDKWKLFLVDWGYNTPRERERAAANPRIEVIDLSRFTTLAGAPILAS